MISLKKEFKTDIRIIRNNMIFDGLSFLPDDVINIIKEYDYVFTFEGKLEKTIITTDKKLIGLKNNKFMTLSDTLNMEVGTYTTSITIWDVEKILYKMIELGYTQKIIPLNNNKVLIYYYGHCSIPNKLIVYDTNDGTQIASLSLSINLNDICLLQDSHNIKFIAHSKNLISIFSYTNNQILVKSFDVSDLKYIKYILVVSYNKFIVLADKGILFVFNLIREELLYNTFNFNIKDYDILRKMIQLNNSSEILIYYMTHLKFNYDTLSDILIFNYENMTITKRSVITGNIDNILSIYDKIIIFINDVQNQNTIDVWDNKLTQKENYVIEQGISYYNELLIVLPDNSISYIRRDIQHQKYLIDVNFEHKKILEFKLNLLDDLTYMIALQNNKIVCLQNVKLPYIMYIYK